MFRNAKCPMRRSLRSLVGIALLAALLSGCSSLFSELPTSMGGMSAGVPERAATPTAYPAVHDMPPPRSTAVLTEQERQRAEAELAAARDRQTKRTNSADQP
jgi:hypothetical protein